MRVERAVAKCGVLGKDIYNLVETVLCEELMRDS